MRLNGNTYDQNGNPVGMGSMGADDTRSIGAAFWEFTHPGQVQEEYKAVGKPPPSYAEIISNAAGDFFTAAAEGEQQLKEDAKVVASGAYSTLKIVAVIAVAIAAIYLADRMPSQGRVKRYASKQFKRARRSVARRVAGA